MERTREDALSVVPEEDAPDRPRVVEEAYEVLGTYAWQLTGLGVAAAAAWFVAGLLDVPLSPVWLLPLLIVLVVLYLAPVTREPRLARDVLRRWDVLRVERALESTGVIGDPRLEVAEGMADRILRHPSVDERVRRTTRTLVAKLRFTLRDLRRVEYLGEVKTSSEDRPMRRSISDLHDLLDARAAEVLGQIAELHRSVVLRDHTAMERAMTEVEGLLSHLAAEEEVERLLDEAERGWGMAGGDAGPRPSRPDAT